jgi:hypothetical protein
LYAVDYDPFEISVSLYAFHTVVTDFIRIQVTSVTLAASDTFPVVQYARTVHLSTFLRNELYICRKRVVKCGALCRSVKKENGK